MWGLHPQKLGTLAKLEAEIVANDVVTARNRKVNTTLLESRMHCWEAHRIDATCGYAV